MVEPPWNGCLTASDAKSRAWLEETGTALLPWSSQARGFFLPGRANPSRPLRQELVKCWYADRQLPAPLARQRVRRQARRRAHQRGAGLGAGQPFPTFPLIGPRQIAETASSFRALEIELTPTEVKWLNLEADGNP